VPSLTLTAGARLEFSSIPEEKYGRSTALRDPLLDAETTVGRLFRRPSQLWSPRLGLAWTPGGGETVLRGGVGLFYDSNPLPYVTQTVSNNPPFYRQVTLARPAFPHPSLAGVNIYSLGIQAYDWKAPRLLHYNLTLERELRSRMTVSASYAGSRGRHIVRGGDVNAPFPQILADGRKFFPAGAARRNPGFSTIDLRRPDGRSWYDSLQMRLAAELGMGLGIQSSYTFSRTLDESQGTSPADSTGSMAQALDAEEPAWDRGLTDFHRKHNLVLNLAWPLPWRFGSPTADTILRGWGVSAIFTAKSGNPFTPGIQGDYSRTLKRVALDRPNLRSGFRLEDLTGGGPERYFNSEAFVLQEPGTFGNVGRNSLLGPGLASADVAVFRGFSLPALGETGKVQLRAEAFNLLNRANFSLPQRIVFAGAASVEAPLSNAGQITSTTTSARQIQLALRVEW
jgi:hypothetical protein